MGYGGSQARGVIGAVAAGLYHSSQQCPIHNPLSEARNQTRNLMVTSWIRFCCTKMGTPLPICMKTVPPLIILLLNLPPASPSLVEDLRYRHIKGLPLKNRHFQVVHL